jgi:hypothetical protein
MKKVCRLLNLKLATSLVTLALLGGCQSPAQRQDPPAGNAQGVVDMTTKEIKRALRAGGSDLEGIAVFETSTPYIRTPVKDKRRGSPGSFKLVSQAFGTACRANGGDQSATALWNAGYGYSQLRDRRTYPQFQPSDHGYLIFMDPAAEPGPGIDHLAHVVTNNYCVLPDGSVAAYGFTNRPDNWVRVDSRERSDKLLNALYSEYASPFYDRIYWFSEASFPTYVSLVSQQTAQYQARQASLKRVAAPDEAVYESKRIAESNRIDAARDKHFRKLELYAQTFSAATRLPKRLGMTVCSADNRVGAIDQIAGDRVKVLVQGVVVERLSSQERSSLENLFASRGQAGPVGALPIHYLFNGKPLGDVVLANAKEDRWDSSSAWGICDVRFS